MTRINTIDPSVLLDEHLIAEWREMPRIVNELRKHPTRFVKSDIPDQYTLNKGHVKFFRDKLIYLQNRHKQLCDEIDSRGINRNPDVRIDFDGLSEEILNQAMNDWTPTERDHRINIERIRERFGLRKKPYRYKGKIIDSAPAFSHYERMVNKSSNAFDVSGFIGMGASMVISSFKGLLNAMRYSKDSLMIFNSDVYCHIQDVIGELDIKFNGHDSNCEASILSSKSLKLLFDIASCIDDKGLIEAIEIFGESAMELHLKITDGQSQPQSTAPLNYNCKCSVDF